jgi:hypothetical protein
MVSAAIISLSITCTGYAQDATPAPGSEQAASCENIEPRDASFFEEVARTPESSASEGLPEQASDAAPTPFAMPEGEATDEATLAAISELYEQLTDCLNSGDFLRAYALYTDDYLLRNLSEEAISQLQSTPVPSEDSMQSEFTGVLDARSLDDGRTAALVELSNPRSGDLVILSLLREEDDRLRIDDETVVESDVSATPIS